MRGIDCDTARLAIDIAKTSFKLFEIITENDIEAL